MELVEEKAEYLGDITYNNETDTLKFIERCARQCYRSDPSDSDKSRLIFLNGLANSGHTSLFEHSQIVLSLKYIPSGEYEKWWGDVTSTGYYRFFDLEASGYIGGNLRSWMQTYDSRFPTIYGAVKAAMPTFFDHWTVEAEPQALVPFEKVPESIRRYAAFVYMDNGVLREWTRHRMSYSVESTRYCDYTRDKFGQGSIEFHDQSKAGYQFKPEHPYSMRERVHDLTTGAFQHCELTYIALRDMGILPQIARQVLPMSLMCRAYVSGLRFYWDNFFKLRMSKGAHPNIRILAKELHELFHK